MRGAIITVLVLMGLGSRAEGSCTPTAVIRGPAQVVAAVARTLSRRGIAIDEVEGCPFVRATIAVGASDLRVTIEDPYGRTHDHVLANADAEVVATVIESWADSHEEAPLLAARRWARAPRVAMVDADTPAVLALHHDPVRTLGSSVALETSLGSDGSSWWGLSAAMCVRIGPMCAGAHARLASDARFSGSSEQLETGRTALDLLLVVDLPMRWGDFQVTVGGGVGVGWMRSSFVGATRAVDIDAGGLRADGYMRVELPITPVIAAELGAAIDISPLAHVGTYTEDGGTIAGEPRGFARVSIGLRYGAR